MKRNKTKISLNSSNHTVSTAITYVTITDLSKISNIFNNYFAKVAIDIQSSIRFPKKRYCGYLSPSSIESFFATPTDSTGVSNIISSLNLDKSDGPNSSSTRILNF